MDSKTYTIPEPNMVRLQERLGKLNRRARKLSLPEVGLDIVSTENRTYVQVRSPSGHTWRLLDPGENLGPDAVTQVRVFKHVRVQGQHPHFGGWAFVATIQHLQDDEGNSINLLRTVPSFDGSLPEQYRTCDSSNCDHCHKKIQARRETFIVRHDSGTWKQIGRNCCQDFLGGADPQAIAAQLEFLLGAVAACEEGEGGGWGIPQGATSTMTFLTYTCACIRVDGWMSRGRARALNEAAMGMRAPTPATADDVNSLLYPPRLPTSEYEVWAAARRPTQADQDEAEATRAYVDTLGAKDTLSDYEYNLVTALRLSTVPDRGDGLVASAVAAYQRSVAQEKARVLESEQTKNSTYIGQIKDKITVQATLLRVIRIEGGWGLTRLHKFVTDDGKALTWFCTGDATAPVLVQDPQDPNHRYDWVGLVVGQTYTLCGTVRAHEEYKGVKSTILTRCVFPTPEALAAEAAKAARKAARAAKKARTA